MIVVFRESDRDKFEDVRSGKKSVETRAATPKYASISDGDTITFKCGSDSFQKVVASTARYDSIQHLIESEGLTNVFPGFTDLGQAIDAYHGFPDYEEKIAQYGLTAWRLK